MVTHEMYVIVRRMQVRLGEHTEGRECSSIKTVIAISIISMLALVMSILPTKRGRTRWAHLPKDRRTHYVTWYHVMDMDTNQVVQVIIVVNTAIIIEMGMWQDGMLLLLIIMIIVRADQVTVVVLVHNRNHRQHLT